MVVKSSIESASKLKTEGNAKYSEGKVEEGIAIYRSALEALAYNPVEEGHSHESNAPKDNSDKEVKDLYVTLQSNLSNAYLSQNNFSLSRESAKFAIKVDPECTKAWLRYVEASQKDQYSFEALVSLLLHVKPQLRKRVEDKSLGKKEYFSILEPLESSIHRSLGLSRVSPDFELVAYEGGVAMVSRRHYAPNEVLFVERKYISGINGLDFQASVEFTTEIIVEFFTERLFPEQRENTPAWQKFLRDFHGSWPRHVGDISPEIYQRIVDHLHLKLKHIIDKLTPEAFDELIAAALMCRYNCFYSGFFRTSALANHSCCANIAAKYDANQETVTMITVNAISPGEMMNVKYLSDAHFLMGAAKRRQYLRSWLFWCHCERCEKDYLPTSLSESCRCMNCSRFVHYILPRNGTEKDPRLEENTLCLHCQAPARWPEEKIQNFGSVMDSFSDGMNQSNAKLLTPWLLGKLQQLQSFDLHHRHWSFRILFYFFCVPLTSLINHYTELLLDSHRAAEGSLPSEEMQEILIQFQLEKYYPAAALIPYDAVEVETEDLSSFTTPLEECGSDALKVLELLWGLISSFYPPFEMWAVHRAVCQLILLQMLLQDSLPISSTPVTVSSSISYTPKRAILSSKNALLLLTRHGKYIGNSDAAKWLHIFNLHKNTLVKQSQKLPSLAKIKNALKQI